MKRFKHLARNRWLVAGAFILLAVAIATIPALKRVPASKPVAAPGVPLAEVTDIAADPWSPAWVSVPAVTLPLAAVSTPEAAPRDVKVSAMTDYLTVAFRVEWADDSQEIETLRVTDFADQAAIQIADTPIAICMGQLDRYSHIWHWKANWEYGSRDMHVAYPNMYADKYQIDGDELFTDEDLYARPAATVGSLRALPSHDSPVEHLFAGGFSTITTHPVQNVGGTGVWQNGRWAVIFTRPLADAADDLSLAHQQMQVSFAVWDGKLMQRDGMKYTTSWATLDLPERAVAAARSAGSAAAAGGGGGN